MAIPSSGPIRFTDLKNTFNLGNNLGNYYRGTGHVPNVPQDANVPTSGAISFSKFYGATNVFVYNFSLASGTNATNLNLKTNALAAGWDSVTPIQINVTIGGVLGSTSPSLYAFSTGGITNATIVVTVNSGGYITGAGGPGNATGTAGPAMFVDAPIVLKNSGVVQSGGVGGSGGSGGFGGGGAGYFPGPGAGTGGTGSLTSGGSGGYNSGKGTTNGSPGSGPGAGVAIQGVSKVTFSPVGTILGSQVG